MTASRVGRSVMVGQWCRGSVEEPGAEHGGFEGEALGRFRRSVAGQRGDPVQAIGDGAYGQVQLPCGGGVVALVVEQCGERVEEGLGAAACGGEWAENC